jgi:hypothetical protein
MIAATRCPRVSRVQPPVRRIQRALRSQPVPAAD